MNETIFRLINDLGRTYTWLDSIAVFFAKYMVYVLLLAVIIFWFSRQRENRIMVISGICTIVLAYLLGRFAGLFHHNLQPFAELQNVNQLVQHKINNSFPSDHTMTFFALCTIFWLFKKPMRYGWMALAVLVGMARIMVGVHYPLDVTVGALIGIVSAFLSFKIIPRLTLTQKVIDFYEKIEVKIWPKK